MQNAAPEKDYYEVEEVAKAASLSIHSVRQHRRQPGCPLSGDGMRRRNSGRGIVASAETLAAYLRWLKEPVPPASADVKAAS